MTEGTSWVGKPDRYPDESLASYLRHFARDNFFGSRSELLRAVEVSPALRPDGTEIRLLAEALGVPHAMLDEMAPSDTPAVPALRRSLTRAQGDAVCPECLRQASYSRRLWSHQLATACPEHLVQLIDQCPGCAARLRHDRPLAHICDCGYDLRGVESKPAEPIEVEVASLLEGRTPPQPTLPLELSSGVPPDIDLFLLEFIYHFGSVAGHIRPLKLSGLAPAPRLIAHSRLSLRAIARVTNDWPATFSSLVSAFMQTVSPRQGEATVSARLGSWYKFLFRRYRNPAYSAFRNAAANTIVLEHVGPIDVRNREILTACTLKKDWMSLTEAGRELGVNAVRLARGVEDGRIQAFVPETGYRQRSITRTELERLRFIRDDHCDKAAAAAFLGVPASVFSVLADSGLVSILNPATLPPVTRGCVSRSELQALASRLLADVQRVNDAERAHIAIRDLNLRRTTDRQRLVKLCVCIGDGSFPLAGHDGTGVVGGIFLAKERVQERIASFSVGVQLNLQQISALTGVHYDSVKGWVDTGVLCARQTGQQGNPHLVELKEFVRFLLEYSPLSCLASQMRSSSRGLTDVLERRGVQLVWPTENRGVLVRIRDMVRVQSVP